MPSRRPAYRHRQSAPNPDEDDVFVAKVFEISAWAKNNSQTLTLMVVVLAILAGGGIYYMNYRSNLNRQANVELERIQQTVGTGDLDGAKGQLTGYLERFGNTREAAEARLLLGQVQLASSQPELAIQALGDIGSLRAPLGVQSGMLLAKAYEEVGRLQDAVDEYLAVADAADLPFQSREALTEAARVKLEAGDPGAAADLYRRIIASLDDDASLDMKGLYELRLAEAQTAAQG